MLYPDVDQPCSYLLIVPQYGLGYMKCTVLIRNADSFLNG